jgi:hypothetical protein
LTKFDKQQLKNEMKYIYKTFLKNKIEQWKKRKPYHFGGLIFENDIARVLLFDNSVSIVFKEHWFNIIFSPKHVFTGTNDTCKIRKQLRLLKQFVIQVI